ncbi:MAG: ABC transporter ATP-binding protein [Coriobacteriia bacterium]|nr:ABC transporter ATP-binding protein [Coriobacteriia bacterium]
MTTDLYDQLQINVAVRAQGLSKSFGKKQALTGLDFQIDSPSITGLLGRNGAGKTTLLKMCAGHIPPSNGLLQVWGKAPLNNLNVLSMLIYSTHDVSYSQGISLRAILNDYVRFFPNFDNDFATGLLEYFDLDVTSRYARLSTGQKSTFNFAAALAARAPLTMLDEPTLGMDVAVRKAAYEVLVREYSEHPRCFIIASHLMAELENLLDSILILDAGKLVLHDSIDELRQSAYQLRGPAAALEAFTAGKKIIRVDQGEITTTVVVHEPAAEEVQREAQAAGLHVSALSPEELYICLTQESKGGDLECLW